MDAVVRSGRPAGRADVCRPSLVCRIDQAGFVPSPAKRRRCRGLRRRGGLGLRFAPAPCPICGRAPRDGAWARHSLRCGAPPRAGRARVSTWRRGVLGRRCRAGPSCGGDQGWRSGHCSGPNASRTCGGGRACAPEGPVSSRQAAARVRGLPADDGVPPPQKA